MNRAPPNRSLQKACYWPKQGDRSDRGSSPDSFGAPLRRPGIRGERAILRVGLAVGALELKDRYWLPVSVGCPQRHCGRLGPTPHDILTLFCERPQFELARSSDPRLRMTQPGREATSVSRSVGPCRLGQGAAIRFDNVVLTALVRKQWPRDPTRLAALLDLRRSLSRRWLGTITTGAGPAHRKPQTASYRMTVSSILGSPGVAVGNRPAWHLYLRLRQGSR